MWPERPKELSGRRRSSSESRSEASECSGPMAAWKAPMTRARSASFWPSAPGARSAASMVCSAVKPAAESSSTAARSWPCSSGERRAPAYTRSREYTESSASAMQSSRPPASTGLRPPVPSSASTLRARPVKDSTSAYSGRLGPATRASSRSASWLYCSGTSRQRPPSCFEAAWRISSMICAVLPAPARPVMSLSMARDPLTFVQHYNIYFSEFKTLEKATLLC